MKRVLTRLTLLLLRNGVPIGICGTLLSDAKHRFASQVTCKTTVYPIETYLLFGVTLPLTCAFSLFSLPRTGGPFFALCNADTRLFPLTHDSYCNDADISHVLVGAANGQAEEATFELRNPLDKPAGDVFVDPESLATYIKAAHEEADEGELDIHIPVAIQEAVQAGDHSVENGMTIKIFYELANPIAGLHFVLPSEMNYPNRPAHMYSNNTSGARCWMPCSDTQFDRCRWVLEFEVASELVVAASGVAVAQPQDVGAKDPLNSSITLQRGSAEIFPQAASGSHSKDTKLKRYTFVVETPVTASSIGFAVGKFDVVSDSQLPGKLTFYNLPGRSSLLGNTVGFVSQSLQYLETILHSQLPGQHLKLVFVDDTPTTIAATAGMILCSTHLLHSQDVIEQTYETRRAISVGLAMQWFPILVTSANVQDSWVISGIIGYLAYLNYKTIFGHSEFRAAVMEDLNYVLQGTRLSMKRRRDASLSKHSSNGDNDDEVVESHASLITNTLYTQSLRHYCTHERYPNDPEPIDLAAAERLGDSPFVRDILVSDFDSPLHFSNFITSKDTSTRYFETRSTLAMLQLEKMVGGESTMHKLIELLVRPDENTRKPVLQNLTAKRFFRICEKSVTKDFSQFASDWIYQHCFPHLYVGFQYHSKTRDVEFGIKQDTRLCPTIRLPLTIRVNPGRPNTGTSLSSSTSSALSSVSTATIPTDTSNEDEADNAPEEHQILLEGSYQQFFAKVKAASTGKEKAPKKKKRASSKKASKMDMDNTDDEDDMDEGGAEGEEARSSLAQQDLGWIRVDPELEWLRHLSFSQPEYMWINQLEYDRDVLAQFEGIDGLVRAASSERACDALDRVLRNKQLFFKVRMRAASALGVLATKFKSGFVLLRRFFLDFYCDHPDSPTASGRTSASTTAAVSTVTTPGNAMDVTRPSTPATANTGAPSHMGNGGEEEEEEYSVRPNDFGDFEAYFLQKAVVHAIATIRDFKNVTPPEVLEFLTNLLDSNDNSRNAYSDNYYVASLITALTYVRSENPADYDNMVRQMDRYLGKEKNMPCFHNVIAQACLHFLAALQANGRQDLEIKAFKPYFRYGNFPSVRAVAMRCYLRLAICVSQSEASLEDMFTTIDKIMQTDPSMWFKEKTAFALATALESGVDLDPIINSPKSASWQKILHRLINSKATSYSPRLQSLLLTSLQSIDGFRIAEAPKLPPRKLLPTRPLKTGSKKASHSASNKRAQQPEQQHNHHSSSTSARDHSSHSSSYSAAHDYPSERPQRKAAARARMNEDPFESILGSTSYVTTPASSVAPTGNKPKKLIIAKLRVNPSPTTTTNVAVAESPAPTPAPTPIPFAKPTAAASYVPVVSTAPASTSHPAPLGAGVPSVSSALTPSFAAPHPISAHMHAQLPTPTPIATTGGATALDSSAEVPLRRTVIKLRPAQTPTPSAPAPTIDSSTQTIHETPVSATAADVTPILATPPPSAPTAAPLATVQPISSETVHATAASALPSLNVNPTPVATALPAPTISTPSPASQTAPVDAAPASTDAPKPMKFVFKRSTPAPTAGTELDAPAAKKPKTEETS